MPNILRFCLLALFALPAAASVQYSPRQDIATGFHNLGHVAVADFNGDGKPDLAVSSSTDPTLLVYLNTGNGTFAAPLSFQLSTQQTIGSIFAGDFNEDGKQDLVVTTLSGNQQAIFLAGNGNGTFVQQEVVPNSASFLDATVIDLNHDGHLDLVTANSGNLQVFLGDGHGNFAAQPLLGPGGTFFGLAVADFNKDQKLDIVTGNYTYGDASQETGIRFYAGLGDGTFNPPSYSTANYIISPYQFAAADFDGDGNLDLLFSQPNTTVVLFGNGDGTFKLSQTQTQGFYVNDPSTLATAPPFVAAADMNVDSRPDGIVADIVANSINVFLNDGVGNFYGAASFSAPLDAGTSAMKIADLNGDGLPDIILTNYRTQNISIFLSVSSRVTPTVALVAPGGQPLAGSPLTFTATVTGASGLVPTGTVTLFDGSDSLGQQTLNASGQATFTLPSLAAGQHSLTASYSGDANYSGAVSSAATQSVTALQLSLAASTQTVSAGASATYSLSITPAPGFTGTASLSCSGLPSGYTCANTTATLAGQPTTVSLTVTTPSSTQARTSPRRSSLVQAGLSSLPLILLFPLLLRRRSKTLPSLLALGLVLCAGVGLTGCGSNHTTPTPSPTSTTTSFTITATATQAGQTFTSSTAAVLVVTQ